MKCCCRLAAYGEYTRTRVFDRDFGDVERCLKDVGDGLDRRMGALAAHREAIMMHKASKCFLEVLW